MRLSLAVLPVFLLFACNGEPEPEPDPDPDPDPITTSATITPEEPCATDGLLAAPLRGTPLSYAWRVDGSPSSVTGDYVDPQLTAKGQVWAVSIEIENGAAPAEAEVTIRNCGPWINTVTLTPEVPLVGTPVTATVDATDPDGDAVTISYKWFVDGVEVEGVTGSRLLPGRFVKGQAITVEVTAADEEFTSAPTLSAPSVVGNSPPTAPRVAINPNPANDLDILVCQINAPATDPDGDPVTYRIDWTVDGEPSRDPGTTFVPRDTIPWEYTSANQEWRCIISASDGDLSGPTANGLITVQLANRIVGETVGDLRRVTNAAFNMGCEAGRDDVADVTCGEAPNEDETPRHRVVITRDSWMMEREVTQALWNDIYENRPSFGAECDDCPVDSVNWYEALAFANEVSEAEGFDACYTLTSCSGTIGAGCGGEASCTADTYRCASVGVAATGGDPQNCEGYRLPTEAEWEFAARAGGATPYAGRGSTTAIGWHDENSEGTTHPICRKERNDYGVCDLSGNVREWTWDWYSATTYPETARVDPTGPTSGTAKSTRGGDWANPEERMRIAARSSDDPAKRDAQVGFRLVRTFP